MKQFQRPAALVTVLALLFTLVSPAFAAEDTVSISSVSDFLTFAKNSTRDAWSLGLTVELNTDLDLEGSSFTPIPIFQGTFHGNGHTISGLSFEKEGSKVGLFRTLTESAVVEDLTVEGTLAPQGSAGQAGLLAGENNGVVRRCAVQGSVFAQEDVGGLVGLNGESGLVSACSSSASVTGVTNTGGIAGRNLGTVEGCVNTGGINLPSDQETPTNVGGIAGLSRGTIRDCTNAGEVGYQHVGYNMGGIAGLQSGEITRCSNTAPIRGRKDVGGIVGQFEPSTNLTYGDSPSQQLTDSLSALFTQLERFTNQLNSIISQGTEGAQAIHDSLSAIQDQAHAAGTEGREDFQAMSDSLYQYTTDVSAHLDDLRTHLNQFSNETWDGLSQTLELTDDLLDLLDDLLTQTDDGLSASIRAMKTTASRIRSQVQEIRSHRQAMEQELDSLRQYVDEVTGLLADGQFEQALRVPFPNLDPAGHAAGIVEAMEEIARLAARLPQQWGDIYDETIHDLTKTSREIQDTLDDLSLTLSDLIQSGDQFSSQSREDLDGVSQGSSQIRDLLKEYTDTLSSKTQSVMDGIDKELTAIQDRVDSMNQAARGDNDALHATSQAILDQMEAVRQAISQLGREPQLTVTDLTDEVSQGPGLVMDCTVSAPVEGDSNVGGIVGTVSPELGDDPEATFDLGDLKLTSDVYATLRAVVRSCRFDGGITVKNECGGGVAGRCEAGAILDCFARGTVETGGDYCGGIVGRTRGKVIRCAALTDLTGGSWLGGIAGLGGQLTDCRAMVQAQGDGEYRGAIAGQCQDDFQGNRYLMEDLAGVDGVDYQDAAQGLDFDAFSQLDGIPADFLTFSYRFQVNGQTVAEIPFSYGEDLDLSQVPQPPQQDGQYGQWPQFPTQNLRRSLVLEAQFTSPTATLADQSGVAQLLVEGIFSPDAALTVAQEELPGRAVAGYTSRSAWSYAVTGSQSDTLTIRLRTDGGKYPAAAIYKDGNWALADAVPDGSYLVFSGPVEGQILLLEENHSSLWILALGGGGVILAAGLAVYIVRRSRRSAAKSGAEAG